MSEPLFAVLISFALMAAILVPLYFVAKKQGKALDNRSSDAVVGGESAWLTGAESNSDSGGGDGGGGD